MTTAAATQRKQRPGGRELAAIVHTDAVETRWARWSNKLRAIARPGSQTKIGTWFALEGALMHADRIDQRLSARIDTLESEVAGLRGDAKSEAVALKGEGDRVELELRGEVTRDVCDRLINRIEKASPRDEVVLRITSPGGDHGASVDLAEALIAHKGKVRCVAEGQCASAATTILAAADRDARLATPDATFLIHKGQGGPAHRSSDFIAGAEHADSEYLARWFSKRTGRSWFTYRKMLREDGPAFGVARARELGLVSDILPAPTRTRRSSKSKRKAKSK